MSATRRLSALLVSAVAACLLAACSHAGDGSPRADQPGTSAANSTPSQDVEKPSKSARHDLSFKKGTVCNLVPKSGIEGVTHLTVVSVSSDNSDKFGKSFVDPDLCTYTFSDWPGHNLYVSRLSGKLAQDTWKLAYSRVQSGENKHGKYIAGLGGGAIDTSSFYLVRVGSSVISIMGSTLHKDERDKAADDAVAYVLRQLIA